MLWDISQKYPNIREGRKITKAQSKYLHSCISISEQKKNNSINPLASF